MQDEHDVFHCVVVQILYLPLLFVQLALLDAAIALGYQLKFMGTVK